MPAWIGDIEELALANTNFRQVRFTGGHTQLTVMRLLPVHATKEEADAAEAEHGH